MTGMNAGVVSIPRVGACWERGFRAGPKDQAVPRVDLEAPKVALRAQQVELAARWEPPVYSMPRLTQQLPKVRETMRAGERRQLLIALRPSHPGVWRDVGVTQVVRVSQVGRMKFARQVWQRRLVSFLD